MTKKIEMGKTHVLVLRTCNADMTSHGGFLWPKKGLVKCDDWRDDFRCGGGLHGWLWGEGYGSLGNWDDNAKWLVVMVAVDDLRHGEGELIGKCKFREGMVVFCGTRKDATDYIISHGARGYVIGATATAGVGGTATAGYWGTATAGDGGTATAGDCGTATAGYRGTATAGVGGTATAGDFGTAAAGVGGTATAGDCGIIQIKWFDGKRYRIAIGYAGENVKANTPYRVDDAGNFVEVSQK